MKSKAVLLSIFTTLSDIELKQLIELKFNAAIVDIDRVLISDSTYINDIDNNNNFPQLLTCNVPDLTLHEVLFMSASLKEHEIK